MIEQWGSGIGKILNLCSLADIPEPHLEEYQELTGVSKPTATTNLRYLVQKEIFNKLGVTGRGTGYVLSQAKR